MGLDPLSPIAPARVRVLLLPVGKIKHDRFSSFIERLRPEYIVHLGDISPDARPNRNMFSPLAFPPGKIIYDLTVDLPPPSHLALASFELYREPLIVLGISDGAELGRIDHHQAGQEQISNRASSLFYSQVRNLDQELEAVRDTYSRALVHQLFIFDYVPTTTNPNLPDGLIGIPPLQQSRVTTLKTVMCDVSSLLLAEMTTLARSFQGMKSIESPNQTSLTGQAHGYSWSSRDENSLNRDGQYDETDLRTSSPGGSRDRSNVRRSLPPQLARSASGFDPSGNSSRPSTPGSGAHNGSSDTLENGNLQRVNRVDAFRDHSRDRISVQGFGSGGTNELFRSKGKGRIGVAIGSLYLQAGRWNDALREFVESASIGRTSGDHLWHAKALENLMVSMLMLAWAGLNFQIPQICYVSTEKSSNTTTTVNAQDPGHPTLSRIASLSNLAALLPELLSRILHLYERSANRAGEALPQLPYSETALRFATLLASLHLAGGTLSDQVLEALVYGKPSKKPTLSAGLHLHVLPTRPLIVEILFKAFPSTAAVESLSTVDRAVILSGIASVLGDLGLYRKKGMVMQELVSVVVPGLVQARVIGAADIGVHPAAGTTVPDHQNGYSNGSGLLELSKGDIEVGVYELLNSIGQIYGTLGISTTMSGSDKEMPVRAMTDEAILDRIMQEAKLRAFGEHGLKLDVLRACLSLAEALPDFAAVLKFAGDLLRTAGSGIAPGARSEDASPSMAREEQLRLISMISRTISSGKRAGLEQLQAEYWDEFLVRKVELVPQSSSRSLYPHVASEVKRSTVVVEASERNPFIYNPFSRTADISTTEQTIVVNEPSSFKVTLQNPFDFELNIDSVQLESDGADFSSAILSTVIGPYRSQVLTIAGTAHQAGSNKITGCTIKVRGCRKRRFPIFREPWSAKLEIKLKTIGLASVLSEDYVADTTGPDQQHVPQLLEPVVSSLPFMAITSQPILKLKSCSLSQSATMVLEGESQKFTVTLQNTSPTIAADLILFSFQDSTQAPLQTALSNRDASPAELYEYERILLQKPALQVAQHQDLRPHIAPNEEATFEFVMLGKPGLTHCTVQIDYAYLGIPADDIQKSFFTRQLTYPITVTVNAGVELARMDILPLSNGIPAALRLPQIAEKDGKVAAADQYCLLVLDVRNSWPKSLLVRFNIDKALVLDESILPGNTTRVVLPMPRVFLDKQHSRIPALNPARQRQFVVSSGPTNVDAEKTSREAFWYREYILSRLVGTWQTTSGLTRSGTIEMRGIHLSPRMIDVIRLDEVEVLVSIQKMDVSPKQPSKSELVVQTGTAFGIVTTIVNRSGRVVLPLLRLQPALRFLTGDHRLDTAKKLAWDGTLQRRISRLAAEETIEVLTIVTALCRGEYEVSASVEGTGMGTEPRDHDEQHEGAKQQDDNHDLTDTISKSQDKRMWHTRTPCTFRVLDPDDNDEEM